ncbi:hypothetical protein BD289DRAFT_480352 [Coniella lustricola]|uniref:Uncharacterized protein n=1 Tax=Coniella lustricola TaxID=2025994 RepID=A0A2T3AFU3_9PEZI|nr:hypothetical protein BD289DRAFT_480352 [Coniella lustricola]
MSQFSPDTSPIFSRPGVTRSRTQSMSSDKPSTVAQSVMSPPISVSPEAAFIAAPSASQIVTNDHDSHADAWYDQHGVQSSGESVEVSDAALHQLNNFLDHLLFNFLALAGSTSLANLRPAVSDVLKPKLAKEAINNADEELREYLGGDDDDEFLDSPVTTSQRDWDLELAWKRARLRCMVYSSLGDMEEEDEDRHMEEGLLSDENDETSGSSVTPAVAIFLTSILEYLGEQALVSAGQAAWNRLRIKHDKEIKQNNKNSSDFVDRVAVDEVDMERVALDRTLGRLWRAWKKRVRSGHASVDLSYRPASREKMYHQRLGSLSAADGAIYPPVRESADEVEEESRQDQESTPARTNEEQLAAAIPLPMGERDVDEIECPGLAYYSDDATEEDDEPKELTASTRPKSMMIYSFSGDEQAAPVKASEPPITQIASRRRASSLPPQLASAKDKRSKVTGLADPDQASSALEQDVVDENTAVTAMKATEAAPVEIGDEPSAQPASETQTEQRVNDLIEGLAIVAPDAAEKLAEDDNKDAEEDDGDSVYEDIEEAQILTSSRISIGGSISGRSDSPASSDRGSRPPLSIHLPVRTGSLRLVDVSSPRTPSSRSQRNSLLQAEGSNSNYSRSVSRNSSINPEEPRETDENRSARLAGPVSINKARGSVAPSISEAEELGEPSPMSATLFPRRDPAAEPNPWEHHHQQQQQQQPNQTMFGSVKRQAPVTPQRAVSSEFDQRQPTQNQPAQTPPADSVTYMGDDIGPLPTRFPRQTPRSYSTNASPLVSPMTPAVPEKSSSRYQHSPPQGPGSPSGSIGVLSVQRPAGQKDRDGLWPSPEQKHSRTHHTPASSISSHKLRAARGSQDSTATQGLRNFEELIQSNETIQYTLTPDNMREIEGSPRSIQSITQTKNRRGEDGSQTNTSDHPALPSPKSLEVRRSNSVTRATGLRSHPVELPAGDVLDKAHPPISMATRTRGTAPQARDARLARESVLEFADFIRATGPTGADGGPVPPKTTLRRNPSLMRDQTSIEQSRPSMSGSIGSKNRLQARDATVNGGNDNSDLIDFIRQGPPSAGNHRIPRTVAPFRTTMDSDQMSAAVGGGRARNVSLPDAPDMRGSQASTNITEMSAPSVQSSVNSQSALLGTTPVVTQNGNPFDEPDMMPVRKQRRVRDPYAIDLSDEDEDDDDDFDYEPQPSRKPPAKEESLIDFLNSAPPPPPSDPVPFNLSHTKSMPVQPTRAPKKKASTPSLIARFRQNSSISASSRSQTNSRSVSSRSGPPANKGYVPIQVNIPTGGDLYPSFGSTTAPAVPSIPAQHLQRPNGRVPMKKFEPREAASTPSRGTSDLADFLRSEPPPPMSGPPAWAVDQNEGNSSKLFGRRKKRIGFT